jgi:NodT family efflux transporter outer membrane factor (OMF) lipoprotein
MKKKKISCQLFLLNCILLFTFSACTSQFKSANVKEQNLPNSYKTANDSLNIAEINWKQYFSDSVLAQLIDNAITHNLDLLIALQKIEISRSGVRMAKGAMLPQVGLNLGGGFRKFGLYTMDGAGNISTEITPGQIVPINLPDMFVGLQASWEIDIWGKLKNQRKTAISNYLSSVEGTNFVISNLVAEVAISYYELLALDSELDLVQKTILKQQDALETVKAQKKAGRTNELALQQFSANLLRSKILEKEALQQIVIFENKINFLLGRFPQTFDRSKEVLLLEPTQFFNAGIPSQLLKNRPDIRKASFLVQASKFNLNSAKAAFYPSLNITASLGFQAFKPQLLFNTPSSLAYNTLGSAVMPLINRNALKAHFNNAKASQLTALYEYQKTVLNGFVEVSNELSNVKNLKEMNELKKQQSNILTQAVETSNQLFMVGKASYLEVLIAQQSSLQAELELIVNTKNQKIAGVSIYKALGGGWR